MTQVTPLDDGLFLLADGDVNSGLIIRGQSALLVDCSAVCTPELLAGLGAQQVEGILVTQHRRDHVALAAEWLDRGAVLYASGQEAALLAKAGDIQDTYDYRWMRYSLLRPDLTLPAANLPVARAVQPGYAMTWHDVRIEAVDAAGTSAGALAWLVMIGEKRWLFCGAAALEGGRLRDLWSLQKGFGVIQDYHGALGAAPDIRASWQRFLAAAPTALVPSYGPVETDPAACLALLDERTEQLQRDIAYSSALNYYFPELYDAWGRDLPRWPAAEKLALPDFITYIGYTSFLIRSQDGCGFLVDCGSSSVIATLNEQIRSGLISGVEGVWISHMHYDHTEGLVHMGQSLPCPVYASDLTAVTLRHPSSYFLPCQYPAPLPVISLKDGAVFRWREFTLTAYEYPGQTLHHGGLLVEGHGRRVLFVGDSFAPNGFDDYCPQNRVLAGPGRGLRRCLELIRRLEPDCLINQHQPLAFHFNARQIDELDELMALRETRIEQLTGRAAGWALDDAWMRAFPFETEAAPGDMIRLEVHLTGHESVPLPVSVTPLLPKGWQFTDGQAVQSGLLPALSSGSVLSVLNPDLCLAWRLSLPPGLKPETTVRIPLQAVVNGIRCGTPALFTVHIR